MDYMDLLQKTLVTELAKEINKRKKKEEQISNSPEEVFANLPLIYDEKKEVEFGAETGKSYKFMPKQYKAMVMRLVAPEYCPSVRVTYNDFGVMAEAYLFLHQEDNKPVAQGKQFLPFSAAPEDLASDAEKRSYLEATVRGMALSKAYQEFGIGSWYNYRFEPEDNPDEAMGKISEQEGLNPTMGYDSSSAESDASASTEQPEGVTSPNKAEDSEKSLEMSATKEAQNEGEENGSTDDSATVPETEVKEESDKESSFQPVDYNELQAALERVAPCGKAKTLNLTLGATAKKYPQNLCWMYQQPIPDEDKQAIQIIAKSNPEIMELFEQNGITF